MSLAHHLLIVYYYIDCAWHSLNFDEVVEPECLAVNLEFLGHKLPLSHSLLVLEPKVIGVAGGEFRHSNISVGDSHGFATEVSVGVFVDVSTFVQHGTGDKLCELKRSGRPVLHADIEEAVVEECAWAENDAATCELAVHDNEHHGMFILQFNALSIGQLDLDIETF